MSEETKDIILDVKDSLNETPKNMYKYNKITLNLNEFEEILNYIEQLENIIKEVREYTKEKIKGYESYIHDLKNMALPSPTKRQERQELIFRIREQEELLEILDKESDNNG